VPQTLVAGQPGDRLVLDVTFVDGRKALPIVKLRRAAQRAPRSTARTTFVPAALRARSALAHTFVA
jgi:hypothetical protein